MTETQITILSLILSFFGGGIVSSIVTALWNNRRDKIKDEKQFLKEQIHNLYGPLYYYISQSEKLFELNKRFYDAYNKEYVEKNYSHDEYTQKMLEKETSETISIANEYIHKVEENNRKIVEILDKGYAYIDPDDIDLFQLFYEHHIRLEIEKGEDGRIKTPFEVYQIVGDISFLRPEIINRVKEKFLKKKKEINS